MNKIHLSILILLSITLRFPQSTLAERRGLITSAPCPYSCRSQGIPKKDCRDWKEGNICYVENLRERPAPTYSPRPHPTPKVIHRPRPVDRPVGDARDACRKLNRWQTGRPRVEIDRMWKSGNIFKDKYKVRGTIEGTCIVEAGYYENGRLVDEIPVRLDRDFGRYEYEVRIRADRDPEIRVYNIHGERDVIDIDPDNYDRNSKDYDRDDYRHREHDHDYRYQDDDYRYKQPSSRWKHYDQNRDRGWHWGN